MQLDAVIDGAYELLDEEERARAARFLTERDRRRFVAAHAATRLVLASFIGRPPATFAFARGDHGKPSLAPPHDDVHFNISHGGERALIAASLGRAVGVDVEQERDVDELRLAARFFASGEAASLAALPPAERRAAFFRCWTRKEAFIKALGDGLSFPLSDFEVTISAKLCPQALRSSRSPAIMDRWRVVPLEIDAGYAAALAAEAGDWRIVRWTGLAGSRA